MGIWIWACSRRRQLQSHLHDTTYCDSIENNTPNDLLGWMAQAARESVIRDILIKGGNSPDVINIGRADWEYGPSNGGVNGGVLRRAGGDSRAPWRGTEVPNSRGIKYEMLPNGYVFN